MFLPLLFLSFSRTCLGRTVNNHNMLNATSCCSISYNLNKQNQSREFTAAMLVYTTIARKIFKESYYIIMQNLSDILPLFCTPAQSSYYVSSTYSFRRFVSPEKTASGSSVILFPQRDLKLKRCLAKKIL